MAHLACPILATSEIVVRDGTELHLSPEEFNRQVTAVEQAIREGRL
jgi:hypothetical protein